VVTVVRRRVPSEFLSSVVFQSFTKYLWEVSGVAWVALLCVGGQELRDIGVSLRQLAHASVLSVLACEEYRCGLCQLEDPSNVYACLMMLAMLSGVRYH
jgi:hypothetical protein